MIQQFVLLFHSRLLKETLPTNFCLVNVGPLEQIISYLMGPNRLAFWPHFPSANLSYFVWLNALERKANAMKCRSTLNS